MQDGREILAKREGNTALTFALLAPLIVLFAGGTVDYVNASQRRAQLQQAADAAAVAAVARYSPGYQAANQLTAGGAVPDATTSSSTNGVFNANWSNHGDTTAPKLTGTSCGGATFVCRQGTNVYSAMTATATFTPSFLGVLGLMPGFQSITTMPLTVKAQATASTPTYVNYFIIVDASQSMGIASTAADMSALYTRVVNNNNGTGNEVGCVFGCHVQADNAYKPGKGFNSSYIQSYTNEDLAHDAAFGAPITLRIDSAKAAIKTIISQAQQAAGGYANIQIALYTMSHDPTNGSYYKTIAGLSSNYTSLTTAADAIDLGGNNMYGYGDTDYTDELGNFFPAEFTLNKIVANGSGATAATAENYVFIITDGLSDDSGNTQNSHPTKAFDPSLCKPMKSMATVGVIYTTYIPIYNQNNASAGLEGNYAALAAPYTSTIPTNLQSCTSDASQFYFEASDGPALISKMQQLFAATQKVAHVSQ